MTSNFRHKAIFLGIKKSYNPIEDISIIVYYKEDFKSKQKYRILILKFNEKNIENNIGEGSIESVVDDTKVIKAFTVCFKAGTIIPNKDSSTFYNFIYLDANNQILGSSIPFILSSNNEETFDIIETFHQSYTSINFAHGNQIKQNKILQENIQKFMFLFENLKKFLPKSFIDEFGDLNVFLKLSNEELINIFNKAVENDPRKIELSKIFKELQFIKINIQDNISRTQQVCQSTQILFENLKELKTAINDQNNNFISLREKFSMNIEDISKNNYINFTNASKIVQMGTPIKDIYQIQRQKLSSTRISDNKSSNNKLSQIIKKQIKEEYLKSENIILLKICPICKMNIKNDNPTLKTYHIHSHIDDFVNITNIYSLAH